MKRLFLSLLTAGMLVISQNVLSAQGFNFSKGENVGEESLLSPYKGGSAIYVRHDSTFIAELNEDGSIKTLTYTEDFSRINPDGQKTMQPQGDLVRETWRYSDYLTAQQR